MIASAAPLRKTKGVYEVEAMGGSGRQSQAEFLRGGLAGAQAPPVDGEAAGQGDDDLFAPPGVGGGELGPPLFDQPIVRLLSARVPGTAP